MKNLCSNCFKTIGIKQLSLKRGIESDKVCENCNSKDGKAINETVANIILEEFVIEGTRPSAILPPIYIHHHGVSNPEDVLSNIDEDSLQDIKLLSKVGVFNINFNMPKTFQAGATYFGLAFDELLGANQVSTDHTKQLLDKLDEVLLYYQSRQLEIGENIFRIRINPKNPELESDFDTPPFVYRKANNRLNDIDFPVFYGAFDLETCIYESKFDSEDDLFFVHTETTKPIKVFDFSELIDSQNDIFKEMFAFEDMLYFSHFVFNTYRYIRFTQLISRRIFELGYNGIIYPSYYSRFRDARYNNIALFGEPLKTGLLKCKSKGRVIMNKIKYDYSFGPVLTVNEF